MPATVRAKFGVPILICTAIHIAGGVITADVSDPGPQLKGVSFASVTTVVFLGLCVVLASMAWSFSKRCDRKRIHREKIDRILVGIMISKLVLFGHFTFRLVETCNHNKVVIDDLDAMQRLSPAVRNEGLFLLFDAAPMLIHCVVWMVCHPALFIPVGPTPFIGVNGREISRVVNDKRPLWMRILHFLTFFSFFGADRKHVRPVLPEETELDVLTPQRAGELQIFPPRRET